MAHSVNGPYEWVRGWVFGVSVGVCGVCGGVSVGGYKLLFAYVLYVVCTSVNSRWCIGAG